MVSMHEHEMRIQSREELLFNIQEARIHLQELEFELDNCNAVEPVSLLVQLGHIQEHLCLAWNSGICKRSDDAAAYEIPNWNSNFELIVPMFDRPVK